jgi:hypothetical protein
MVQHGWFLLNYIHLTTIKLEQMKNELVDFDTCIYPGIYWNNDDE